MIIDRETRGLSRGRPAWAVSQITQLPVTKRRPYPLAQVLSRLLALSEYDHFCDMMRRAHGEMVDVDDPDAGYYT